MGHCVCWVGDSSRGSVQQNKNPHPQRERGGIWEWRAVIVDVIQFQVLQRQVIGMIMTTTIHPLFVWVVVHHVPMVPNHEQLDHVCCQAFVEWVMSVPGT